MSDQTNIVQKSFVRPVATESNFAPAAENNSLEQNGTHFFLQAKSMISSPDDPLENEADTLANKVVSMPEENFVQSNSKQIGEQVQRKAITSFIQRKETSPANTTSKSTSTQISAGKGKGENLDASTQSFMSSRLDANFKNVKIHTDDHAIRMNRDLNARAFTIGNDIFFNKDQFSPNSIDGKHLLAHELVHVIQQQNIIQRKESNDEKPWSLSLKEDLAAGHYFGAYLSLTDHLGWKNYDEKKKWLASQEEIRYLFLKKLPTNIIAESYSESELILMLPHDSFEIIDCWYQTDEDKQVLYANNLALFDKLVSLVSPYTGEQIKDVISNLEKIIAKNKYPKDSGNKEFHILHLLAPTVERKIKLYHAYENLFKTIVKKFDPYSGISLETFETITDTNEVDPAKAKEIYVLLKLMPEENRRAFLDTALFAGGLEADKDAEAYYNKNYKAQYKELPHNWDRALMPWNWSSWDAPFAERLTIDHAALMSSFLSYEYKATREFGFDKGIDSSYNPNKGQSMSDATRLIIQLNDPANFNKPQRLKLLLFIAIRGGQQKEVAAKVLLPKQLAGEIDSTLLKVIESAGFIQSKQFEYIPDKVAPDAHDNSPSWYLAKRSLFGGKESSISGEQRITVDLPSLQDTSSDLFMDGMYGSVAGVKFGTKAYENDEFYNTTWIENQINGNKASNTLLPNLKEFKGNSRQGKIFASINGDEKQANIYASSLPMEGVNYFSDGTLYRSGEGIIQGLAIRISWTKDSDQDDNNITMELGFANFMVNDFQMVAPKSTLAIGQIAMNDLKLTIDQSHLPAPSMFFRSAKMTVRILMNVLPDVLKLLPYAVMTMTEEFSGAKAHVYKDKLGAIMDKDFYSLKSSLSFTSLKVKNMYDTKAGFLDDFSIEQKDDHGNKVEQKLTMEETNMWTIDAGHNIRKRIKTLESEIRSEKAAIGGNDFDKKIEALEKEQKELTKIASDKGLKYEPRDAEMNRLREVMSEIRDLSALLEKQFLEAKETNPAYDRLRFDVWYAERDSLQKDLDYLDEQYFSDVNASKNKKSGADRYEIRKRKAAFESKYKSVNVRMNLQGITLEGGNYVRDLINDSLKSVGFISPSMEGVENIKIGGIDSSFISSGKGASTLDGKPGVLIKKLQIPIIKAPALAFRTGTMLIEAGSPRLENVFASVIIDFVSNPLDRDLHSPYKYKLWSLFIGKADFNGLTLKIGEAPPLLDFPTTDPVEVWGLRMFNYDPEIGNINIGIDDVKAKGKYVDKNTVEKSSQELSFGIDTTLDNGTAEGKKKAIIINYNKEENSVISKLNIASVWLPAIDFQSPTLTISSLAEKANAVELKNIQADLKVLLGKKATDTEQERPMKVEINSLHVGEILAQGIKVVMKEDISEASDTKKKASKKVQELLLPKEKQVSIKDINLSGLRLTMGEQGTTLSKLDEAAPSLSLGESDLGGIKYIEKNTKGSVLSTLALHNATFDSLNLNGAIAVNGREYNMKEFLKFFGSTHLEGLDMTASYAKDKTSATFGLKGQKNKAISIEYHPPKDEKDDKERGYYDIRLPLAKIKLPALNLVTGDHKISIAKAIDKEHTSFMKDVDVRLRAYIEFGKDDKMTYDIYLQSLDIEEIAVFGLEYHNTAEGLDVVFDKLIPLHIPKVKAGGFRFSSGKGLDVFGKEGGWVDIKSTEAAIEANFEKIQSRLSDGTFLADQEDGRSALAIDIASLGFRQDKEGNKTITLGKIHGGFPNMKIIQVDPKTHSSTATIISSKDKTISAESVEIKLNADSSKVIDAKGLLAGDIIVATSTIQGKEKTTTVMTLGSESIGAASVYVKENADATLNPDGTRKPDASKEIILTDIKGGKINVDFLSSGSKGISEKHLILPDPELIKIELIKINIDKQGNKLITVQKPTIRNFKLDVPSQSVVGDYMNLLCDLKVDGNIEMGEGNFNTLTLAPPYDAFVLKVADDVPVEINNLRLDYKDRSIKPPGEKEPDKGMTSDQLKLLELEQTLIDATKVKEDTPEYKERSTIEPHAKNPDYPAAIQAYETAKRDYDHHKASMIANAKSEASKSKTKKYLDAVQGKVDAKLFLFDSMLSLNIETYEGDKYVEISNSLVSTIHTLLQPILGSTVNASFWNSKEIKMLAKVLNGKYATYATPSLSGYLKAMIDGSGVGALLLILEDAVLSKGTYLDDANFFGLNIELNSSWAMDLLSYDEYGVVALCEKKYKHPNKADFYNLYGIIEHLGYVNPQLVTVAGKLDTERLNQLLKGEQSEDDLDDLSVKDVGKELVAYIVHSIRQELANITAAVKRGFKGVGVTADVSLKPEEVINMMLKEKQAGKLSFDKGKKSIDDVHIQGSYMKEVMNKAIVAVGSGATGEGDLVIPGATYTSQDLKTKVSYASLQISKMYLSSEDDLLKVINKSINLKNLQVAVKKDKK